MNNSDIGLGSDMTFFYEDSNNLNNINNQNDGISLAPQRTIKNEIDPMEIVSDQVPVLQNDTVLLKNKRQKDHHKYTQIKVNVGIDEDLKMILEMVKKENNFFSCKNRGS